MLQKFGLLLIISFFLCSCTYSNQAHNASTTGSTSTTTPIKPVPIPATATPLPTTPTATQPIHKQTVTPTPSKTHQPSPTPTNYLFPTVEKDSDHYQLKQWQAEDINQSIEDVEEFRCVAYGDFRPETLYHCSDFDWYRDSMLQEMITRFPGVSSEKVFKFQWALSKAYESYSDEYGIVHGKPVEPFRNLLENALNNGEAFPEAIDGWFRKNNIQMNVQQFEPADGLTGSHTQAWVLIISSNSTKSIFTIEKANQNSYRLIALNQNWEDFFWSDEKISIFDLTGNQKPEIAVYRDYWGVGMSHFCRTVFSLYEWDGHTFISLLDAPIDGWVNTNFGECIQLSFEPDYSDTKKIVYRSIPRLNECGTENYVAEEIYRWNGHKYVSQGWTIPSIIVANPITCVQINWALDVGFDNPIAIKIIKSALNDWPDDATEHWGPAAEDFVRFQWALWQYQKGRVEDSRKELERIRDHPADSSHQKFPAMAELFLTTEEKHGPTSAVQAVNRNLDADYEKYVIYSWSIAYDTTALKDLWGVADDPWLYGDYFYVDPIPYFIRSIQSAKITIKADLVGWLEQNKIEYAGLEETDIDGNGLNDWICLVGTNRQGALSLWAFLQTYTGVKPVFLQRLVEEPGAVRSKVETFIPSQMTDTPVSVYQWDDDLIAFHLSQQGSDNQVVWDIALSYKLGAVSKATDWELQETPDGVHLYVNYDNAQNEYTWDQDQKMLIATGFSTDLQEHNIAQIEEYIYREGRYDKAIEALNTILAGKIREDLVEVIGVGIVNPPRIRPYALYLLGLAYELRGDEANAVKIYWKLWNEYPESPYVLVIMNKLVPK